jgi:hypothetical protein
MVDFDADVVVRDEDDGKGAGEEGECQHQNVDGLSILSIPSIRAVFSFSFGCPGDGPGFRNRLTTLGESGTVSVER